MLLSCSATRGDWPQYESNPFVISTSLPAEDDGVGGIITADLDNDGLMDYLLTKPGHVAGYAHSGAELWHLEVELQIHGNSENNGLPGWAGPGVQAADVDGDGETEVLFLTQDARLHIVTGSTGETEKSVVPWLMEGVERWEHVIVANLRGEGDRDLIFQACPTSGPDSKRGQKRGRLMAALPAEKPDGSPLWTNDKYWGPAHGTARIADLDGDGRDEVLGVTILDDDGSFLKNWKYTDYWNGKRDGSFHLDSVFVRDMLPESPGMEVVLLEEGANHISLCSMDAFFWRKDYERQEPQNAAVGEFDLERPGLEIWCRSRYPKHQKPWVMGAEGEVIAHYEMDNVAPEGWTDSGVEVIWTIDWTGEVQQLAAAKERHESGDIAVFEPMTGRFVERFAEKADRIYVADVSGDWREEITVVNGSEIHVYHNAAPNPRPDQPRLWEQNHYLRSKTTWNYYSP